MCNFDIFLRKSAGNFGDWIKVCIFADRKRKNGLMAEWLGRGLQNLVQRFESASDLQEFFDKRLMKISRFFVCIALCASPHYAQTIDRRGTAVCVERCKWKGMRLLLERFDCLLDSAVDRVDKVVECTLLKVGVARDIGAELCLHNGA